MDESVYSLIPPKAAEVTKASMYRSSFNKGGKMVPPTASTFGLQGTSKVAGNVSGDTDDKPAMTHQAVKATGSFGKPVAQSVNPKNFLKKTTGGGGGPVHNASTVHAASADGQFHRAGMIQPKPPVPSKVDKPVMGLTTDKNFVVANAVESILAAPKRAPPTTDRAVEKQTFGQVPAYLNRIKAEMKQSKNATATSPDAAGAQDEYEQLDEQQVAELRRGLNERLAAVQKQFQSLSFTIETRTQKARKETLERTIEDIESCLKKLNKRRVVVVE